jgi:hypothetical protein
LPRPRGCTGYGGVGGRIGKARGETSWEIVVGRAGEVNGMEDGAADKGQI